jgi:hypothetical protein
MGYSCKECGLSVIILKDGSILRPCGHKGTIIADMDAIARGISRVNNGNYSEKNN